jgi:hypothetical protein
MQNSDWLFLMCYDKQVDKGVDFTKRDKNG